MLAAQPLEQFAQRFSIARELSLVFVGLPGALLYGLGLVGALRLLQVQLPTRPRRLRAAGSRA